MIESGKSCIGESRSDRTRAGAFIVGQKTHGICASRTLLPRNSTRSSVGSKKQKPASLPFRRAKTTALNFSLPMTEGKPTNSHLHSRKQGLAASFLRWYLGGALLFAASAGPLIWPEYFAQPLLEPGAMRAALRLLLLLSPPLAVFLVLRSEALHPRARLIVGLIVLGAALFCEHLQHLFVDRGHYFPVTAFADNSAWQRDLQNGVLHLQRSMIPHSYRFLSHSLVAWLEWLGGSFEFGRGLYRTLFDGLLFATVFRFARLYLSTGFAIATLLLVVLIFPVTNGWHAGQFVDPASHLSFAICFFALARGFNPAFGPSLVLGVFAKESVVVMAVARAFQGPNRWRSWCTAAVYFTAAMAGIIAIRLIVNRGQFSYDRISGVGFGHIMANLRVINEWGPQYLATLGILLPGAWFGWRLMDRQFQWMCMVVTLALVASSALFSWLSEVRNLFPAVILLAVVNMKLAEAHFTGALVDRGRAAVDGSSSPTR